MDHKERVIEMYKEAALDVYKTVKEALGGEYGATERELFAEKYGRRQAYARVLREIYGVQPEEFQHILDNLHR